jgi:hypothetical protein
VVVEVAAAAAILVGIEDFFWAVLGGGGAIIVVDRGLVVCHVCGVWTYGEEIQPEFLVATACTNQSRPVPPIIMDTAAIKTIEQDNPVPPPPPCRLQCRVLGTDMDSHGLFVIIYHRLIAI